MNRMKRLKRLVLSSLPGFSLLLATPAFAATIYVPTDANIVTIQDGIDAARNGDTVLVKDGTYPGGINFKGKLITVRSENGARGCIIDGGGKDRGVLFTQGESNQARLQGFTIKHCSAAEGGGIYLQSHSSPIIADCVIQGNSARAYSGGGIGCYNSSPIITNCVITGNSAPGELDYQGGGGIACRYKSSPTISHCTISGNQGLPNGGGIYVHNSSPSIDNCLISDNRAHKGGGMQCGDSSPLITNCTFARNEADHGGGGIGLYGGSGFIVNCLVWANSTLVNMTHTGASGIHVQYSAFPTILNCTIVGNYFTGDPSLNVGFGGIVSSDSVPVILNSIIWGNSQPGIYAWNTSFYPNRYPLVSYCDIQEGYSGDGNINADPLFLNAVNGDFHLQPGSPCIDTASDADAPNTDADGNVRPQDGNDDGIAVADMGAYELTGAMALSINFVLDPSAADYIPDTAFRDPRNRAAFANKIEVVLQLIVRGQYGQALQKLQNDLLKKVDGCVTTGKPDKDDWIIVGTYQAIAYERIVRAVTTLQSWIQD